MTERIEVQDDEREQETDDQEPQDVLPVFFPVLFQVEIFHRRQNRNAQPARVILPMNETARLVNRIVIFSEYFGYI